MQKLFILFRYPIIILYNNYETEINLYSDTVFFIYYILYFKKSQFDNSVIWEIRKIKEVRSSYVLGTVHIMDTAKLSFPIKEIEGFIDHCEVLCVEAVLDIEQNNDYIITEEVLLS